MKERNNSIKDGKQEKPDPTASAAPVLPKKTTKKTDSPQQIETDPRQIRLNAEGKVADGIGYVLALAKQKAATDKITTDFQGITTVVLSKQEIEKIGVAEQFPFLKNQPNGITVHIFKNNSNQFPPLRYILEQKLNSLVSAAKIIMQDAYKKLYDDFNIEDVFDEETNRKIDAIYTDALSAFKQLADTNTPLDQWPDKTTNILQAASAKLLHFLHQTYYKNNRITLNCNQMHFKDFAKLIINESIHHRSTDNHTLTYCENSGVFSFDEVVSTATAHDRTVGKGVANLSVAYEGQLKDNKATITTSTFKHASPVAIDDVSKWYVSDMAESNDAILDDTKKNIQQIATAMAQFQVHGGADPTQPVKVKWIYQMLTSNAGDRKKQARTYGYIVKAKRELDGKEFTAKNNLRINLDMHVMNAGINMIGGLEFGHKCDTQRQENRLAFLHLSQSVPVHLESLDISRLVHDVSNAWQDTYAKLTLAVCRLKTAYSDGLIPRDLNIDQAFKKKMASLYQKCETEINREVTKIKNLLANEKALIKISFDKFKQSNPHAPDDSLTNYTKYLDTEAERKINAIVSKINNAYQAKFEVAKDQKFLEIENELKVKWKQSRNDIQQAINTIRQNLTPAQAELLDSKILTAMTAMIYKSYIDDLYYSGEYRNPQKAVLFNSYVASYQRLTGLTSSIGCKSANDRAYVLRLFLAAIEGRDRKEQFFPPAYHHNKDALRVLKDNGLNPRVMSNAALYSCINDTAGGTPKVDDSIFGFTILRNVTAIKYLDKFGQFAADKFKKMVSQLYSIAKQTSTLFAKTKKESASSLRNNTSRYSYTGTDL